MRNVHNDNERGVRCPILSLLLVAVSLAALAEGLPAQEANATADPSLFSALEYRMIGPFRGGRSTARLLGIGRRSRGWARWLTAVGVGAALESPPLRAAKPISPSRRAPVWPSRARTAWASRSIRRPAAAARPRASAVPEGASTLWR